MEVGSCVVEEESDRFLFGEQGRVQNQCLSAPDIGTTTKTNMSDKKDKKEKKEKKEKKSKSEKEGGDSATDAEYDSMVKVSPTPTRAQDNAKGRRGGRQLRIIAETHS